MPSFLLPFFFIFSSFAKAVSATSFPVKGHEKYLIIQRNCESVSRLMENCGAHFSANANTRARCCRDVERITDDCLRRNMNHEEIKLISIAKTFCSGLDTESLSKSSLISSPFPPEVEQPPPPPPLQTISPTPSPINSPKPLLQTPPAPSFPSPTSPSPTNQAPPISFSPPQTPFSPPESSPLPPQTLSSPPESSLPPQAPSSPPESSPLPPQTPSSPPESSLPPQTPSSPPESSPLPPQMPSSPPESSLPPQTPSSPPESSPLPPQTPSSPPESSPLPPQAPSSPPESSPLPPQTPSSPPESSLPPQTPSSPPESSPLTPPLPQPTPDPTPHGKRPANCLVSTVLYDSCDPKYPVASSDGSLYERNYYPENVSTGFMTDGAGCCLGFAMFTNNCNDAIKDLSFANQKVFDSLQRACTTPF